MTRTLLTTACVALMTAAASAQVYVPPGLETGDMYHLVFVTEGTRDASSSSIADYNSFVQAEAERSPLTAGVDWFAIASAQDVNARQNTPGDKDLFRLDGVPIVTPNDYYDLSLWEYSHRIGVKQPQQPVNLDQFGNLYEGYVWTGAFPGSLGPGSRFNLGGAEPYVGHSMLDETGFWSGAIDQASRDTLGNLPLYAMSEPLTVPVPEPSAVVLMVVGLGATVGALVLLKDKR